MYTNILVPVVFDHGDHGATALKVARKLMTEAGKITLLNVMEEVPSYASTYLPEGLARQRHDEAEEELAKIRKAAGASVDGKVVRGHASSSILHYAKNHDIDCIVIASHKPGLEDYFLGSTAARVVRHAKCGVHVLR